MNGSRLNTNARGERSSLDALNRTIEGLEARIEGLLKASAPREMQKAAPLPSEPSARMPVSEAPLRPHSDALAEIRERQRMLDAARERRTAGADFAPRMQAEPVRESAGRDEVRSVEPRRPAPVPSPASALARALDAHPSQRPAAESNNTGTIAQALHDLRRELRQDISENIAREMQALRDDVQSMRGFADGRDLGADLRDELARLADGIDMLSSRTPSAAADLRGELDDLRALIDGLARQDSLHSIENRWNAVEERLEEFDASGIQKELIALAYRIDGVKAELGTMADSPAIRTLEDKVLMLAAVVEDLAQRPLESEHVSGQFSHIDYRLDELSRAVAANNTRPRNEAAEHEALRRLEERLIGLHDKIESLAHVQDAYRLEERLEELAEFFARGPQQNIAGSLADLTARIEALASEHTSDGLGRRLEDLTHRIDSLATAPTAPDTGLGRLEIRLDEIAARLEEASAAPQGDSLSLLGLEKQIAHLSSLMSEPRHEKSLPDDFDQRMAAIEGYMATSDEYVLEAARQAAETVIEAYSRNGRGAGSDATPDTATLLALAEDLRHLEDLARGSEERTQQTFTGLHRTLNEIADRLDRMEGRMGERQTALFGGAPLAHPREETQTAVRPPMAQQKAGSAPTTPEAGEPRGMLARANEQLMAQTAGSPAVMEPHAGESDATNGEDTARGGLLSGLSRRFRRSGRASAPKTKRTRVEPTPSLDPGIAVASDEADDSGDNDLLEPGSGTPDVRKILERVRATQAAADAALAAEARQGESAPDGTDGERMDYIAAARRAAKAAALEMGQAPADTGSKGNVKGATAPSGVRATFARHRRPILMAVGAVLLALMAMPLFNTLTRSEKAPAASITTGEATRPAATQDVATSAAKMPAAATTSQISTVATPGAGLQAPAEASANATAPVEVAAVQPAPQADVVRQSLPAEAAAPMDSTGAAEIVVPEGLGPQPLADAAAGGNPQALFEIGARFTEGQGVTADPAEAARWYGLAADRGYAPAQYRLGSLYEKGTGVTKDLTRAVSLYEQAAAAGNAGAMHNLAVLYASGATGNADYKAAVEWFGRAADLGITDSQFNLAILFARGNGAEQNLEESYKWFAIAANGGDRDAAAKRDEVAKALKPAQLESAKARLAGWKQQPLDVKANGTNLPTEWVNKADTSASIDMGKAIRNIQAILNRNGFDAGQPDGLMGKKTVTAIRAFQRSNGLAEDGTISEALVRKLLEKNKVQGA